MYFVRGVFYVFVFGIIASVLIRGKFDGVAFLCVVVAVMAFVLNLFLETQLDRRNTERYYNDVD